MFRYRPKDYSGRITLLVNEEQYKNDPYMGWRKPARGGVKIIKVPGNHLTRITDHAGIMAEKLRECIDKAQK